MQHYPQIIFRNIQQTTYLGTLNLIDFPQAPVDWTPNPGASLDNEAFWKAFRECASKLPKNINTAFCLREIDEIESAEICRLLNISENNLWVMLHRARMALRKCLEANWFGKGV